MSEFSEYSLQATLAFAAYADLDIGEPDIPALTAADMSTEQAERFSKSWTVIDQYTDATGASATVFEDTENGERHLAIRGTEGFGDIAADGLLAAGFPRHLNPQFIGLRGAVQEWIDNGTLTADFSIAGHSLGGYLGVGLGTSFAEAGEVYTYNAPGLHSDFGRLAEAIYGVFELGGTARLSDVTNIRGTAGVSVIAGYGQQPAPPILIETESHANPFDNHGIAGLSDALSLYALFEELDPSLEAAEVADIIKSSSDDKSLFLENTLDALRKVVLGGSTPATATGNRDLFYENYYALKDSAEDAGLLGSADIEVLSGESATSLADRARNEAALRYALDHGRVMVLHNDRAIYHEESNASERFSEQYLRDRATYVRQLHVEGVDGSDDGVDDAFLLDLATDNDVGVESPLVNRRVFGSDEGELVLGARVGASEDRLYGGRGDDVVQGFGGDDRLEGQRGNDTLEGGCGHDTYAFQPGDGRDSIFDSDGEGEVLVEGEALTGADARAEIVTEGVVWEAADGTTYTLLDGDLQSGGTLKIDEGSLDDSDAITISNFENGDLGIELNPDRGVEYSFDGTTPFGGGSGSGDPQLLLDEGGQRTFQIFTDRPAGQGDTVTLTLDTASAGDFVWHVTDGTTRAADTPLTLELTPGADHVSVTLEHKGEIDTNLTVSVDATYTSAGGEALGSQALDITVVDGAGDDPLLSPDQHFYGDRETVPDADPDEPGYQDPDVYGNRPTTGNAEPGREDVLFGSTGNDEMEGLEGTDVLNGRSGDDLLRGGGGDDVLLGQQGNDVFVGGADRDLLIGDAMLADGSSGWQWTASDGITYTLVVSSLSDGIVEISGGVVGDHSWIVIEDFRYGDLGTVLDDDRQLAASIESNIPLRIAGGGSDGQPLELAAGTARRLYVYNNLPAAASDTVCKEAENR